MKLDFDRGWVYGYPSKGLSVYYQVCGYFDNRPRFNFTLGVYTIVFRLPFRNKWTDECDPPTYGFTFFENSFMLYLGGKGNWNGGNKVILYNLPFITLNHLRTSYYIKGDYKEPRWVKECRCQDWSRNNDLETALVKWEKDYVDPTDGEVVKATLSMSEREWYRKWLSWIPSLNYIKRSLRY